MHRFRRRRRHPNPSPAPREFVTPPTRESDSRWASTGAGVRSRRRRDGFCSGRVSYCVIETIPRASRKRGIKGKLDADGDGAPASEDCDDTNPDVHPGAPDACDDIDNDCDGTTDEDAPIWYTDDDGDGFGDLTRGQVTCSQPAGAVTDATDCDDTRAHLHPYDDDGDGTAEGCGWREVSAGGYHTCGLPAERGPDGDGALRCWPGGLPEAPYYDGSMHYKTVSAGLNSTCGITAAGEVDCWTWTGGSWP